MGNVVHPEYGSSDSGYLAKLSSSVAIDTSSGETSGYCVWFPDFTGRTLTAASTVVRNGNWFVYQSNLSSTAPTNTVAQPFGVGTLPTSSNGQFIIDPAHDLVNSDICADARTVAGCVKMTYTGRNDALSGRVGYLNAVPREALLQGGSGSPPSPTDMFRYCDSNFRTPLDTIENKFRPGDGSAAFRAEGSATHSSETDNAFDTGIPGASITSVGAGVPSGMCTGIGFCFEGLPEDSTVIFDLVKTIEWRPEMNSGLVQPPPTTSPSGRNLVSQAVGLLDARVPGWQQEVKNGLKSAGAQVATMAYEGAKNLTIKGGLAYLGM